jgi:hypothetical protein
LYSNIYSNKKLIYSNYNRILTMPTSIGGKRPVKPKVRKTREPSGTKSTGGYNLAPLVSALLLAGIKLSLEQNKKRADKSKGSTSKRNTKSKPRPITV